MNPTLFRLLICVYIVRQSVIPDDILCSMIDPGVESPIRLQDGTLPGGLVADRNLGILQPESVKGQSLHTADGRHPALCNTRAAPAPEKQDAPSITGLRNLI